ncbi:hypothetical protein BDM02DRAFT_3107262 [Thelephora ganbajun]|uniref:Uncharacterized protein n=1 Tax=Thelephora ganbajun TaxID=370292 RepID=A0ACB6ZX84_THEGA|nr:hypothetical protein BDM02DRAFT_3107262 [Thelephora ganbajun]
MLIINPYDRYVSDNSSPPDNAPFRTRISFSRKAAPVVSITTTPATSTGQENRSPTSSIPFPSTPLQVPSTQYCRDAAYTPCPGDPLSTPEPTEYIPPTYSHHRQRSNSGLMSIQRRNPRPLATLNSESRAGVGCIDLGKSTAVLSITSSGVVSRVDNNRLSKTLATSRQRRLQQLDRKRNAPMVTKKPTKKASMDAKFLITLHHSITWHIENRLDVKGSQELDAQDGLLAQRILQHLTQRGQISSPGLRSEVHVNGTLMYPVPNPFPTSDASISDPCSPSPAPVPGPGIMTMSQIVAALHLKHRDRATRPPRPRNPTTRIPSTVSKRSPLSQLC